jgi:hypothetical protein
MNTELEYIDYLIKNKEKIDSKLLEMYFLGELYFEILIEYIKPTEYDVLSYKNFLEYKKIYNFLGD